MCHKHTVRVSDTDNDAEEITIKNYGTHSFSAARKAEFIVNMQKCHTHDSHKERVEMWLGSCREKIIVRADLLRQFFLVQ